MPQQFSEPKYPTRGNDATRSDRRQTAEHRGLAATAGPIGPVRIKNLANGGVSIRIIRPPADTSTLRSVERRDYPTHLGIIGQGGNVIDLSEHHTSSFVDDEDGPLGNPVVTKNAVGVCHRSMGMKITQ